MTVPASHNPNQNHPRSYKLGLIGNGISRSSAPRLHRLAGALCGMEVTYDLLDLAEQEPQFFEATLARSAAEGYRAVNVTYPFKERAAKQVNIPSATVRLIDSVNTVVFGDSEPKRVGNGYNTDYSGFLRAYQKRFAQQTPGVVGLVGTGGVGKPVACGLAELGANEIRLYDLDVSKANLLAAIVQQAVPGLLVTVCSDLHQLTAGVDGLVNCTPVGMWQHPGTPIPAQLIGRQRWAFDVIYTPLETEFLAAARRAGLELLSGYELFFYQGVGAFEIFTGKTVDEERLRLALQEA